MIEYDFKNVYRPSDDTYLIVDYFKHHIDFNYFDGIIPLENVRYLLDMGTGTGYLALFFQIVKTRIPKFNPKIIASDILKEAINLAKLNEKLNNFKGEIEFIHSDLFKSFPKIYKQCLDIIVFNPPYLPSFVEKIDPKQKIDRSWDGGEEGFEIFIDFISQAKEFLRKETKARIYYICSSRTKLNLFYNMIKERGFKNTILERRHIFLEDIYLNMLETYPD